MMMSTPTKGNAIFINCVFVPGSQDVTLQLCSRNADSLGHTNEQLHPNAMVVGSKLGDS